MSSRVGFRSPDWMRRFNRLAYISSRMTCIGRILRCIASNAARSSPARPCGPKKPKSARAAARAAGVREASREIRSRTSGTYGTASAAAQRFGSPLSTAAANVSKEASFLRSPAAKARRFSLPSRRARSRIASIRLRSPSSSHRRWSAATAACRACGSSSSRRRSCSSNAVGSWPKEMAPSARSSHIPWLDGKSRCVVAAKMRLANSFRRRIIAPPCRRIILGSRFLRWSPGSPRR